MQSPLMVERNLARTLLPDKYDKDDNYDPNMPDAYRGGSDGFGDGVG